MYVAHEIMNCTIPLCRIQDDEDDMFFREYKQKTEKTISSKRFLRAPTNEEK